MDKQKVVEIARECGFDPHDMSCDFTVNLENILEFAQRIQPQWMPIESAPKDGTEIMLWEKYSDAPFVGWWVTGGHWAVSHEHVDAVGGWEGAIVVDRVEQKFITHWMPLPKPPEGNP